MILFHCVCGDSRLEQPEAFIKLAQLLVQRCSIRVLSQDEISVTLGATAVPRLWFRGSRDDMAPLFEIATLYATSLEITAEEILEAIGVSGHELLLDWEGLVPVVRRQLRAAA